MPEDSIWASIKADWHDQAVCAGANDYQFFPKIETEQALKDVRDQYCDLCPVRAKCLNSALINGDSGFWGGTSTAERMALKKARRRATCPLCRSNALISVAMADDDRVPDYGPFQVCVSCGASWRSKARLRLVQDPVEAEIPPCP